jgi:hypothetical protein
VLTGHKLQVPGRCTRLGSTRSVRSPRPWGLAAPPSTATWTGQAARCVRR